MKIFKILAILTISVLVFTGCEDEEITNYAFQDISAPENVSAQFDVSQDDSGTVTITPSGEGASMFQIDLGNGETAEIAAGESVTTVYDEGEYLVNIVAVGSTGLTSEYNQMLNISFKAPENLVINVDQPASNPMTVTVTASADNAASFDVYFGDVEDEEPTQLMPDGSVEHTYEPGVYELTVIARGAGAATAEEDEIIIVPDAQDPLKLPVTFDDPLVGYNITPFGDAATAFEIVTNPQLSGTNDTESMVGQITKAGAAYEGVTFNLSEAVDLSSGEKTFSVKIYSETAFTTLLKLEEGVNGERANEVQAEHGGTGWETLTYNFGTDAKTSYISNEDTGGEAIVPAGQYDSISLFLDLAGSADGVYYIDDLMREGDMIVVAENFPIGFEDNTTFSGVFEGGNVTGMPVENPDMTGNTSATVYEFVKGEGSPWYSGIFHIFPQDMDLSQGLKFSFKMWSPKAGINVRFQLEKEGDDSVPNVFIDKTITEANQWVTLTYDFSDQIDASGTYDKFVIFPEFDDAAQPAGDGSVYYFDDVVQGDQVDAGESTTTSFPVNFESAANGGVASNWSVFENGDNPALEIISNPDMTGNTSATVAKFTARPAGQTYAGTVTELTNPLTLDESNSFVKIMVWKSVISDVGIKFETSSGAIGEIKVPNTETDQWEELTFDFSGFIGDANAMNITKLVVFPDFQARTTDNVIYFDNITLNEEMTDGGDTDGGESTDAPTTAATAPTADAADVISIFSDAYTDPAAVNYYPNWNQSTTYEMLTLDGESAIKYANVNYQGIEFGEAFDLTSYSTVKIDVWSGDYTSIAFFLISQGSGEKSVTLDVTPNTWTTIEIPLSEFTDQGLSVNDIHQIKFDVNPDTGGTFYIDNLYFQN